MNNKKVNNQTALSVEIAIAHKLQWNVWNVSFQNQIHQITVRDKNVPLPYTIQSLKQQAFILLIFFITHKWQFHFLQTKTIIHLLVFFLELFRALPSPGFFAFAPQPILFPENLNISYIVRINSIE
jgi:hypothetical protein